MNIFGLDRLAVLTVFGSLLAIPGAAAAADPAAPRPEPSAMRAPASVPSSYVFTHHGWFHPSCVVRIAEDEVVGADTVVRGRADGAAHFSMSPCAYPRFDLHGRAAPADNAAPEHLPPQAAGAPYDGYIVAYFYNGKIATGSTLVTDVIVPTPPAEVADQDVAFFNGIQTPSCIMQPVLDFNGETANKWSIESEQCCVNGNDMQTTPVVVSPGDTIRSTVAGTGCSSSGACSAWAITTADVTTGKSTTLNTSVVTDVPNSVTPASLETYGVSSCARFPANGATTYTNNTLTDPQGNAQTLKYNLVLLASADPEVPTTCGYAGKIAGNDFTLIYGTVIAGTGGSAGGTGGANGTGGVSGTGGRTGTGGSSGTGGSVGGTGGANGTGGVSGAGGSSGMGGSSTGAGGQSVGGSSGTGGHAGGTDGATTGPGDTNDGSVSGGCSCDIIGNPTPGFSLVFAFIAAMLWDRRRRRS